MNKGLNVTIIIIAQWENVLLDLYRNIAECNVPEHDK